MKRHEVDIGGTIVYWELGWSDRPTLEKNLTALRLESHTPHPRTDANVLRQALTELYGNPTTIIRPLRDKSGFAIVAEKRGEEHNDYIHERAVRAENGTVTCDDPGTAVWEIQAKFDQLSALLSPSAVSACLVGLVTKVLGATSLRNAGGMYWVPESSVPRLQAIASAVEDACVQGANGKKQSTVFMMETVKNENCIIAVRAAIENEIASRIAAIDDEIANGGLGERALESRKEEAIELRAKLALYETELGVTMQSLAEQIDRVKGAAAMAAIQAAAKVATGSQSYAGGADLNAVLAGLAPGGA